MVKNQLQERGGRLWSTDKIEIQLLYAEVRKLNGSSNNYKVYVCDAQERIA